MTGNGAIAASCRRLFLFRSIEGKLARIYRLFAGMEALSNQENRPPRGARRALLLLLGINLFNYIDRFILVAVEPQIRAELFQPGDPHAMAKTGSLATAFLVTYMLAAPL